MTKEKNLLIKKCLLIVVVAMGVYLNSLPNGFVWDDEEQVVNNPFIRSGVPISYIFSGSTFGGGGTALPTGGYYKPMMSVWYRINYGIFDLNAWGWHLTQAFLHGVNGVLVYFLFRKLFDSKNDWLGLMLAVVFVVHPGNVESVSYVASAQEVLMLFFMLLSLLIVAYRKKLGINGTNVLVISSIFTLLSMLSKETGVLGIVVIWCYLYFFEKERKYLGYYPLLVLPIVGIYAYLRFGLAGVGLMKHEIIPIVKATFFERMMTVPYVLWKHLQNLVFPLRLFIADHLVIREFSGRLFGYIVGVILILGMMIKQIVIRRSKLLYFFGIWFGIGLMFTSNIYPLDMTFAERWSYFPMISFLGFVGVWILTKTKGKKSVQRIKIIGAIVVILFTIGTWKRQYDWRNGLALFGADVKYAQNAFDLHNNYGVELWRFGDKESAKDQFEKSVLLAPDWWTNYNNLGAYWEHNGDIEKSKEYYQRSIDNGDYFLAWENLAKILVREEDPEAREFIEQGLMKLPNNRVLRELSVYLDK